MPTYVLPYKPGSESAKLLASNLGVKVLRNTADSKYREKPGDIIINWGSSGFKNPRMSGNIGVFYNHPERLRQYQAKDAFFNTILRRDPGLEPFLPAFAISSAQVAARINTRPERWFARTVLTGHSGAGIIDFTLPAVNTPERAAFVIPEAPLYTRYIPKEHEFRFHIVNKKPIMIQRKTFIRRNHPADFVPNFGIRSFENGWTFVTTPPNDFRSFVGGDFEEIFKQFLDAIDLDFYSVDVILKKNTSWYVLEVNTASGLSEITAPIYASKIREMINNRNIRRVGLDGGAERDFRAFARAVNNADVRPDWLALEGEQP